MNTGYALAMVAALGWVTMDLLRKRLAQTMDSFVLALWLNLGMVPLYGVWWWWTAASLPEPGYALPFVSGVVFSLTGQVLFLLALKWSGMSVVLPMLSLTPAISTMLAWFGMNEQPAGVQLLGLCLIVGGSLWHALSENGAHLGFSRGTLAMGTTAVLWSANSVVDKMALSHASLQVHGCLSTSTAVVLLLVIIIARGHASQLPVKPADRLPLLGAVVTLAVAFTSQLAAMTTVMVGLIEGIKRGVGLPMAVFNGWYWFEESVDAGTLLRVTLILAGSVFLTLG